jgi:ABC-type sulfate transport system permease component
MKTTITSLVLFFALSTEETGAVLALASVIYISL